MFQPIEISDDMGVIGYFAPSAVFTIAGVILALTITLYVLRSIGVYTLCKRNNIKKAYLSWIPCLWIFSVCKLIGNSRFFNTTIEKLALTFTIIVSIVSASEFLYNFLRFFPFVMAYLQGGQINISFLSMGTSIEAVNLVNHFDIPFINVLKLILGRIALFGGIVEVVITVALFFPFFRKFWPDHYLLAGMLSFFGLFGIFAFVVRNKKAVDFNEYMRAKYYGAYGNNPNGSFFGGQNPNGYGGYGQSSNNQTSNQSPFSEFEEKDDKDPFEEFSSNKKDNEDKS